jgi:16S rRNA processing protein RimM
VADHLVVARFVKPHGLRGAAVVEALTDEPEGVFAVGRRLVEVDAAGEVVGGGEGGGGELTLARARPFKRGWVLTFAGITSRTLLEARRLQWLGAAREELRTLGSGAMYLHEIPGAELVEGGEVIGVARDLVGPAGAELLVVEAGGKEHLIPFRAPIVRRLDRAARRIEVVLPPGLLEL